MGRKHKKLLSMVLATSLMTSNVVANESLESLNVDDGIQDTVNNAAEEIVEASSNENNEITESNATVESEGLEDDNRTIEDTVVDTDEDTINGEDIEKSEDKVGSGENELEDEVADGGSNLTDGDSNLIEGGDDSTGNNEEVETPENKEEDEGVEGVGTMEDIEEGNDGGSKETEENVIDGEDTETPENKEDIETPENKEDEGIEEENKEAEGSIVEGTGEENRGNNDSVEKDPVEAVAGVGQDVNVNNTLMQVAEVPEGITEGILRFEYTNDMTTLESELTQYMESYGLQPLDIVNLKLCGNKGLTREDMEFVGSLSRIRELDLSETIIEDRTLYSGTICQEDLQVLRMPNEGVETIEVGAIKSGITVYGMPKDVKNLSGALVDVELYADLDDELWDESTEIPVTGVLHGNYRSANKLLNLDGLEIDGTLTVDSEMIEKASSLKANKIVVNNESILNTRYNNVIELYTDEMIVKCDISGTMHIYGGKIGVLKVEGEIADSTQVSLSAVNAEEIHLPESYTKIGERAFYQSNISKLSIAGEVTEIGGGAFSLAGISEISCVFNIEEIPNNAFYGCGISKGLKFEEGLKVIGAGAFQRASINEISIPTSVEKIYEYAFNTSNLVWNIDNESIHNKLDTVYTSAFVGSKITGRIVEKEGESFRVTRDSLVVDHNVEFVFVDDIRMLEIEYDSSKETLSDKITEKLAEEGLEASEIAGLKLIASNGLEIDDYNLLKQYQCLDMSEVNTEYIPSSAFRGSDKLERIILPSTLTAILDGAFDECISLRSTSMEQDEFVIGDRVTTLGKKVFKGTKSLQKVTLGEGISEVPVECFYDSGIKEIVAKDNLKEIKERAFYNCGSLNKLELGNGIESISEEGFAYCSGLEYDVKNLPSSLDTIGKKAFYSCTELYGVLDASKFSSVGGSAFYGTKVEVQGAELKEQIEVVYSSEYKSLKDAIESVDPDRQANNIKIITMDGVELGSEDIKELQNYVELDLSGASLVDNRIPANAFYGNLVLKKIVFPESLKAIGASAFRGTQLAQELVFEQDDLTIDNQAFRDCEGLTRIECKGEGVVIGDYAFFNCINLEGTVNAENIEVIGLDAFQNTKVVCEPEVSAEVFLLNYNAKYGDFEKNYKLALNRYGSNHGCKTLKVVCPSGFYLTSDDYIQMMQIVADSTFNVLDLSEAQLNQYSEFVDPLNYYGTYKHCSLDMSGTYYKYYGKKASNPIKVTLEELIMPSSAYKVVAYAFSDATNISYDIDKVTFNRLSHIYSHAFESESFGDIVIGDGRELTGVSSYAINVNKEGKSKTVLHLPNNQSVYTPDYDYSINCGLATGAEELTVNLNSPINLNNAYFPGAKTIINKSSSSNYIQTIGLKFDGDVTLKGNVGSFGQLEAKGNVEIQGTSSWDLQKANIGGDLILTEVNKLYSLKQGQIDGNVVYEGSLELTADCLNSTVFKHKQTFNVAGTENTNGDKYLVKYALSNADNINIVLEDDIDILNEYALAYLGKNVDIVLSKGLKEINDYALYCYMGEKLDLSKCENVETVGAHLIGTAPNLKELIMPYSGYVLDEYLLDDSIQESAPKLERVDLGGVVETKGKVWLASEDDPIVIEKVPETLVTVGKLSFYQIKFKETEYTNKIKNIGSSAFYESNITGTVIVDDRIESIGKLAFEGTDIEKIVLDTDNVDIGVPSFGKCYNLKKVEVTERVKELPARFVINRENEVELDYRATEVNEFPSDSLVLTNTNRDKICVPTDVIDLSGIQMPNVEIYTESGVLNILKSDDGPHVKSWNVKELHLENSENVSMSLTNLFNKYPNSDLDGYIDKNMDIYLTSYQANQNKAWLDYFNKSFHIVDGAEEKDLYVQLNVTADKSLEDAWNELPEGTDISLARFKVSSEVNLTAKDTQFLMSKGARYIDFTGAMFENDTLPDSAFEIKSNHVEGLSLKFGDSVKYIGNRAFYDRDLYEVEFGEEIKEIGDLAFYCTGIKSKFKLDTSKTESIGKLAFAYINLGDNVESMEMDLSNVTHLGGYMIDSSDSKNSDSFLEKVKLKGDMTLTLSGVPGGYPLGGQFNELSNAEDLTVRIQYADVDNQKAFIPSSMFKNSNATVILPEDCTVYVYTNAFNGFKGQLYNCNKISEAGENAFKDSTLSGDIKFTGSVIKDYAFYGTNIDSIDIEVPKSSISIYNYAFKESSIKKVSVSSAEQKEVKVEIYEEAFKGTPLEEFILDNGYCSKIYNRAFEDCSSLTRFDFGNTAKIFEICSRAFANTGLRGVVIEGHKTMRVAEDAFLGTDTQIVNKKELTNVLNVTIDGCNLKISSDGNSEYIYTSGDYDTVQIVAAYGEQNIGLIDKVLVNSKADVLTLITPESRAYDIGYRLTDTTIEKLGNKIPLPNYEDGSNYINYQLIFDIPKADIEWQGLDRLTKYNGGVKFNIRNQEVVSEYAKILDYCTNVNNITVVLAEDGIDISELVEKALMQDKGIGITSIDYKENVIMNVKVEESNSPKVSIDSKMDVRGSLEVPGNVTVDVDRSKFVDTISDETELFNVKITGVFTAIGSTKLKGCKVDFTEVTAVPEDAVVLGGGADAYVACRVDGLSNVLKDNVMLKDTIPFKKCIIEDDELVINSKSLVNNTGNYRSAYWSTDYKKDGREASFNKLVIECESQVELYCNAKELKIVSKSEDTINRVLGKVWGVDKYEIEADANLTTIIRTDAKEFNCRATEKINIMDYMKDLKELKLDYDTEKGIVLGDYVFEYAPIESCPALINCEVGSRAFCSTGLKKMPKIKDCKLGSYSFSYCEQMSGDLIIEGNTYCDGSNFEYTKFSGRLDISCTEDSTLNLSFTEDSKFNNETLILPRGITKLSWYGMDSFENLKELTIQNKDFYLSMPKENYDSVCMPNLEVINFEGESLSGNIIGVPKLHSMNFSNPVGKYIGKYLYNVGLDLTENTHEYQHMGINSSYMSNGRYVAAFPSPVCDSNILTISAGTEYISSDVLVTKYGRSVTSALGLTGEIKASRNSEDFRYILKSNGKEITTPLKYLPEGKYDIELYWNPTVTIKDINSYSATCKMKLYPTELKLPIDTLVIGAKEPCTLNVIIGEGGVLSSPSHMTVERYKEVKVDFYCKNGYVPVSYEIDGNTSIITPNTRSISVYVSKDTDLKINTEKMDTSVVSSGTNFLIGDTFNDYNTKTFSDTLKSLKVNGHSDYVSNYYMLSRQFSRDGETTEEVPELVLGDEVDIISTYLGKQTSRLPGMELPTYNVIKVVSSEGSSMWINLADLDEEEDKSVHIAKNSSSSIAFNQSGAKVNGVDITSLIPSSYVYSNGSKIVSVTDENGTEYEVGNTIELESGKYTAKVLVNATISPLPEDIVNSLAGVPILGESRALTEYTVVYMYSEIELTIDKPYYRMYVYAGSGGTASPSGSTQVREGENFKVTWIPASGYVANYIEVYNSEGSYYLYPSEDVTSHVFENIRGYHNIYIYFRRDNAQTCNVKVTHNEGGTVNPEGEFKVRQGDYIYINAKADDGYELGKIVVNGNEVSSPDVPYLEYVNEDKEIDVIFEKLAVNNCKVEVTSTIGGTVNPLGEVEVKSGDTLDITSTPDEGYELSSIKVNGVEVTNPIRNYTTEPIVGDTKVEVEFKKMVKKVSIIQSEGGEVTPTGDIEVEYGDTITIESDPYEEYELDEIVVNGVPVVNPEEMYTTEPIKEDTAIVIMFKEKEKELEQVVVNVEASEGGEVTPLGAQIIDKGDVITITSEPDVGYDLDKILVNGVEIENPSEVYTTDPIEEAKNIRVEFKKETNIVDINSSEGGTVEPVGEIEVEYGDTVTIESTPEEGYELREIIINGVPEENPPSVYVTDPITEPTEIDVVFEKKTNIVTIISSEGGEVDPIGDKEVEYGDTIGITSEPNEGYELDKIIVNGVPVSEPAEKYTTEPIKEPTVIEVVFREISHSVVVDSSIGGTVEPYGVKEVKHGDTVKVEFKTDKGYEFDCVVVDGEKVSVVGNTYTSEPITQDTYIKVKFKKKYVPSDSETDDDTPDVPEFDPEVPEVKDETPEVQKERIKITFYIGRDNWYINDIEQEYVMDVTPQMKDNRSFIPIRFLSYALKVDPLYVRWDAKDRSANIKDGDNIMTLYVGDSTAILNNKPFEMDTSAYITNGRTMLPISQIIEVYRHRNPEVIWNGEEQKVDIWLDIIADLNPELPEEDWYKEYVKIK